jgi:hypothetical protein
MLMLDLQNSFNLALFSPSVNFFFFEVLSLKYSNYSLVAWLEKFYKSIVLALEYVFSSQCSLSLNRLVTLGPDIPPFFVDFHFPVNKEGGFEKFPQCCWILSMVGYS